MLTPMRALPFPVLAAILLATPGDPTELLGDPDAN